MNRTLISLSAAALISTLAACGGGGGDAGTSTAPVTSGGGSTGGTGSAGSAGSTGGTVGSTDVISAAGTLQTTPAANTYGVGSPQLSAYEALNVARSGAGAGVLNQAVSLDTSAKAHAEYIIANIATDGLTHFEDATKADFYGVKVPDRVFKAGYTPLGYSTETIGGTTTTGADYVYGMLSTVYHGAALLSQANDVGVGFKVDPSFTAQSLVVADLASVAGYGQVPAAGALVAYPYNGQAGVIETFDAGNETPRVSTALFPNATAGTPVIVNVRNADYVNFAAAGTLNVTMSQFELKDGSGNIVPSTIIGNAAIKGASGTTVNADTNLAESVVVLVPMLPLLKGQLYTYSLSLTLKSGGAALAKVGSFTTAR